MFNSFGHILRITTFGESHGKAVGVIIDGFPAGFEIDEGFIKNELNRRKPGQSEITTTRKEDDSYEILSGVFNGKSSGAPITIIIENKDAQSKDYSHLEDKYRPSHADFTYQEKYGIRDYRGGGRSSARETATWVASGACAKILLNKKDIEVKAFVSQVGNVNCGR